MTSSSTSNSETTPGQRKLFAKILVTIVVGMAVALGLVRLFALANDVGSQSLLGRVLQAEAAIPRIASEDNDLVMFYGSSMVQAGFSPREFDQQLASKGVTVKSFNFGFGGLNPLFQDYLSRRIVEQFAAQDRRLKLVLIEFNPFQTTVTRRQQAEALEEAYIALLASPRELLDIALADPERGLRMMEIRYLRDGISAEMITTFMWAEPFTVPAQQPDLTEDEAVQNRLNEVIAKLNEQFAEDYPDYDGSDWYYPWQGGGTIASERSADALENVDEYYLLSQTDVQMANDRIWRIESADILGLNFDPELVDAFIRIVKNFQQVADHVEVVMLPKNTDWIKNSPEALARQSAVVDRIRSEANVAVRDYQQIDAVSNNMFGDTTHLNRYRGAVAFTHFLAERYADLLGGSAAND